MQRLARLLLRRTQTRTSTGNEKRHLSIHMCPRARLPMLFQFLDMRGRLLALHRACRWTLHALCAASRSPPAVKWPPLSCHMLMEPGSLSPWVLWPQLLCPWQRGRGSPAYTCQSEGAIGFPRYVRRLALMLIKPLT